MNHDYAHCMDYNPKKCPSDCFRAQLGKDGKDLKKRLAEFAGIPLSWSYLLGTDLCELKYAKICGNCRRYEQCNKELRKQLSKFEDFGEIEGGCPAFRHK